ncbi:uncharacterized protein B0I36DRAFT_316012 [Microdochium trichocladiopsis]|uniref:Uncharacterized protein n=1 Tax=Microdochium trichocladiopsis TaxID=1682393 RepID=A0A9P8YHM6_9PEZI|nr:uncharacterized protein B0I36DRAFT_316012 [Microdochium trichocladiopsis]KAH7038325.1 hypothetical protein B0I36DRAFT_316012 [Microdochium trichocladiopsis]
MTRTHGHLSMAKRQNSIHAFALCMHARQGGIEEHRERGERTSPSLSTSVQVHTIPPGQDIRRYVASTLSAYRKRERERHLPIWPLLPQAGSFSHTSHEQMTTQSGRGRCRRENVCEWALRSGRARMFEAGVLMNRAFYFLVSVKFAIEIT